MANDSFDSDYNVEEFVKPKRVRRTVNDETADLLGNFDDIKRQEILNGTYIEKETATDSSDGEEEHSDDEKTNEEEATENGEAKKDARATQANGASKSDEEDTDEVKTNLTKEQLGALMRGAAKANRHVLYVTNLNFETTKSDLESHFGNAGAVKGVRIPKKRCGGFAFVEMADLEGYQRGFQLHNSMLQGRTIKVQFSEAGKKKSANKKNILKQKNRKLAEMRNEQKTFTKSGKFYDKNLKKEKAKDLLARKRWRKPAGARGPKP
nr:nucleolin 1 [Bactrocera oleae]